MATRRKSGGMFEDLKRKMAETLLKRERELGFGQERLRALTEMAGLPDNQIGKFFSSFALLIDDGEVVVRMDANDCCRR